MAGAAKWFPNPVVGNPNPRGRKPKENETKSKSGETKSKAIFLPPIQPFQGLKASIRESQPSQSPPTNQRGDQVKQGKAPTLSARWRSQPDDSTDSIASGPFCDRGVDSTALSGLQPSGAPPPSRAWREEGRERSLRPFGKQIIYRQWYNDWRITRTRPSIANVFAIFSNSERSKASQKRTKQVRVKTRGRFYTASANCGHLKSESKRAAKRVSEGA